jgi:hypothetical protein
VDQISSARKILEAFKEGKTFLCLRDLARTSGFQRASDKDFKTGFNYLVERGVLKLQQSGWRSEERGGKNHPKTVILTADIYEVKDSEFELDPEKFPNLDEDVLVGLEQGTLDINSLTEHRKNVYRSCEDCKKNPIVYITDERIGICKKHWHWLAYTNLEW